jgi:hypothetical protein
VSLVTDDCWSGHDKNGLCTSDVEKHLPQLTLTGALKSLSKGSGWPSRDKTAAEAPSCATLFYLDITLNKTKSAGPGCPLVVTLHNQLRFRCREPVAKPAHLRPACCSCQRAKQRKCTRRGQAHGDSRGRSGDAPAMQIQQLSSSSLSVRAPKFRLFAIVCPQLLFLTQEICKLLSCSSRLLKSRTATTTSQTHQTIYF